jgi:hypothetical protein
VAARCKRELIEAGKAVFYALREEKLVALANVLTRERTYLPGIGPPISEWPPPRVDAGVQPLPAKVWARCPWAVFEARALRPRGNRMFREYTSDSRQIGPVYADPTLATADIDRWLATAEPQLPVPAATPPVRQRQPASDQPAQPPPMPPSGIRTNRAADAESACETFIAGLTERPQNKDAAFEAAQNHCGEALSRKAFDRAWANMARAEWKRAGRRRTP